MPDRPYKQEHVYDLSPAFQEFRFTGEEKEFDWMVIDQKIKFLALDVKKANKSRDQLIERLDIKAEEGEVEAVAQLEATLLTTDQ